MLFINKNMFRTSSKIKNQDNVIVGSIPSWVKSKTIKWVLVASPLTTRH